MLTCHCMRSTESTWNFQEVSCGTLLHTSSIWKPSLRTSACWVMNCLAMHQQGTYTVAYLGKQKWCYWLTVKYIGVQLIHSQNAQPLVGVSSVFSSALYHQSASTQIPVIFFDLWMNCIHRLIGKRTTRAHWKTGQVFIKKYLWNSLCSNPKIKFETFLIALWEVQWFRDFCCWLIRELMRCFSDMQLMAFLQIDVVTANLEFCP